MSKVAVQDIGRGSSRDAQAEVGPARGSSGRHPVGRCHAQTRARPRGGAHGAELEALRLYGLRQTGPAGQLDALAVVQHALAQPDGLWRHFHQLVVADEIQRLLEA